MDDMGVGVAFTIALSLVVAAGAVFSVGMRETATARTEKLVLTLAGTLYASALRFWWAWFVFGR